MVNPHSDQLFVWINALDADDPVRRNAAERALLASGAAARPLLRKALALDDRPLVTARAALLLSRLRDRTAIADLLGAIDRHHNDDVRAVLMRAVTELIDAGSADATVRSRIDALARDRDADVRAWASSALDNLGERPAADAPTTAAAVAAGPAAGNDLAVDVDAADLASFAQLARDAADADVRRAARQLGTGNRNQRQQALQVLVDAGTRGQQALIGALAEPSVEVRTAAAQMLLQVPTPDASGALLMLAAGGGDGPREANLRALALRALAACLTGSEEHIVDDLAELCRDPDRFVRAGAAAALARLPYPVSAVALAAMLDDNDPFVVEEAAKGLGHIGIPLSACDAAMRGLERPVARAHAPLLRGFIGMLAMLGSPGSGIASTLDDADRRAQLRRIAVSQLRSGDGERITAALALLDQLFRRQPIEPSDASAIAALLTARDSDVVRAALGVLATHTTPEQTAIASALDRVDVSAGASIDALVAAVRARLAMR